MLWTHTLRWLWWKLHVPSHMARLDNMFNAFFTFLPHIIYQIIYFGGIVIFTSKLEHVVICPFHSEISYTGTKRRLINEWKTKKSCERPSHTTTETTKKVVNVHTHYNFVSQLQRFFEQFYMGKDFHDDCFGKIVVKIFVVCEGLYGALFCLPGNGDTWDRIFILLLLNLLYNYMKIVMKSCCKMVPGLTRSSMQGK